MNLKRRQNHSLGRNSLIQSRKNESIDEFNARIRHFAIDCQYGDVLLNEALYVQLINGVHSENLKKLLAEKNLSFADLLRKTSTHEQVKRDLRAFWQSDSPSNSDTTCNVKKLNFNAKLTTDFKLSARFSVMKQT